MIDNQPKAKKPTITSEAKKPTLISKAQSRLPPLVYDVFYRDLSISIEQKNQLIRDFSGWKTAAHSKFARDSLIKKQTIKNNASSMANLIIDAADKHSAPKDLDHEIESLATFILSKESAKITPSRKKYLSLLDNKWRVSQDIARFTAIKIDNTDLTLEIKNLATPEEMFALLSERLEEYVANQRTDSEVLVRPGRIGTFFAAEVVAAIGQGMFPKLIEKLYTNVPAVVNGNWITVKNSRSFEALFYLEKGNPNEFFVQLRDSKKLTNVANPKQVKTYETWLTVVFKLSSGEMKFRYFYNVLGRKKSWETDEP